MEKIISMTEEEFSKIALEKGFDKHWIKSCIDDCKNDIEKIKKKGLIIPIPLEKQRAFYYESIVKNGPLKNLNKGGLASENGKWYNRTEGIESKFEASKSWHDVLSKNCNGR